MCPNLFFNLQLTVYSSICMVVVMPSTQKYSYNEVASYNLKWVSSSFTKYYLKLVSSQLRTYICSFYPRPADSISRCFTESVSESESQSEIIFEKSLNGHNLTNFEATTSRFCMVIDLNKTYRMMRTIMMKMMEIMMKTQNGHNSTNFEATTSRFCMVIDLIPTGWWRRW